MIIHEQFEAVDKEMREFLSQNEKMKTGDLGQAITLLPEMQERKRSLEMHTNIARSILDHIQRRGLDRFLRGVSGMNTVIMRCEIPIARIVIYQEGIFSTEIGVYCLPKSRTGGT